MGTLDVCFDGCMTGGGQETKPRKGILARALPKAGTPGGHVFGVRLKWRENDDVEKIWPIFILSLRGGAKCIQTHMYTRDTHPSQARSLLNR